MKICKDLFSPDEEAKLIACASWHRALENCTLRKECPDAYHDELLRQADEMDRLGLIDWREWRGLRREADEAYLRAVAGSDFHE
ncbi:MULTISPECIES: hypothetical protein [Pseudomonas]|uniref:hypothetical protein n=1 Tax=Pseudomonas TaxID=286 RepID=UPI000F7AD306|nr:MULTISPECIES: hypothetical protein [Pseudomonas]RRW54589.1 hypothetical protein EGJ55_15140 [Pseudomonas moraviensis]